MGAFQTKLASAVCGLRDSTGDGTAVDGTAGDGTAGDGTAEQPRDNKLLRRSAFSVLTPRDCKLGGFSLADFILDHPGTVLNDYDLGPNIGDGSFGTVCAAAVKGNPSLKRAVKTIVNGRGKKKIVVGVRREIEIMKVLDHPNIINLYETFGTDQAIYLVMDLCQGGELFDRIAHEGHFGEADAAFLVAQMAKAVCYMHGMSIVHRDLKPENMLFHSSEPISKNVLKIVDFGWSCELQAGHFLHTRAGTLHYVAPQVISCEPYDELCDVWSVGVIMYILLCGYPPFFGESHAAVVKLIQNGKFEFVEYDWAHVSNDAKDLIRCMLEKSPARRCCAERVLHHEWVAKLVLASNASNAFLNRRLVKRLRQFQQINKFKQAALHIIAGQVQADQITGLRKIFHALDEDDDGFLTKEEILHGFESAMLPTPPDLEEVWASVDTNGDGVISYTEFLAATLDPQDYLREEDLCRAAFRVFDLNGDGVITAQELGNILGVEADDDLAGAKSIRQAMSQFDANGDGVIDFDEFMTMMRGKSQSLISASLAP